MSAAFPAGLRRAEPCGIDMVLLDATIAGCVSTWQNNGGSVDAARHQILRNSLADLDEVLPLITHAEERRYCQRLRQLAVLTTETGPQTAK